MSNDREAEPHNDPDNLPSGAGHGDKAGVDDTTSGGAPEPPD